jgi:hypothetical protein
VGLSADEITVNAGIIREGRLSSELSSIIEKIAVLTTRMLTALCPATFVADQERAAVAGRFADIRGQVSASVSFRY